MASTMIKPLDMKGQDEKNIAMLFIEAFLMNNKSGQMSKYYYGITSDIQANLCRHNVEGYTICAECRYFEITANIEKHLYRLGFDIGNPNNKVGNGGNKKSTIVYMIEKKLGFKS